MSTVRKKSLDVSIPARTSRGADAGLVREHFHTAHEPSRGTATLTAADRRRLAKGLPKRTIRRSAAAGRITEAQASEVVNSIHVYATNGGWVVQIPSDIETDFKRFRGRAHAVSYAKAAGEKKSMPVIVHRPSKLLRENIEFIRKHAHVG